MIGYWKNEMEKETEPIGTTVSPLRVQGKRTDSFTARHSSLSFPSKMNGIRQVHEYYRHVAMSLFKAIELSEKNCEKRLAENPASNSQEQGK